LSFRKVFYDTALNPVMVVDEDGRYLEANKAALDFLECSREELLGKVVWDWAPPGLPGPLPWIVCEKSADFQLALCNNSGVGSHSRHSDGE